MKRKTILLIWQYYRKDWVAVFKNTSKQFNYVFLAEAYPSLDTSNVTDFARVVYWSEFSSAFQLIENIKPYKILCMGTESLLVNALLYAARKKKIETQYLQHGIYGNLNSYVALQKNEKIISKKEENSNKVKLDPKKYRNFLIQFYFKTFKLNITAFKYFLLTFLKRDKIGEMNFLIQYPFKYRITDKYLCFAKKNIQVISDRDRVPTKNIIEIGNPNWDIFFNADFNTKIEQPYVLLIDSPIVELEDAYNIIKRYIGYESMQNFQRTLNEYCLKNGYKLIVKLHPYTREKTYYKHPNISYVRNANIMQLIMEAKKVVSFTSSVALPVVLLKEYVLVKSMSNDKLLDSFEKFGHPKIVHIDNFIEKDIQFRTVQKSVKEKIIEDFAYQFDGKATERLVNELKK